MQSDPLTLHAAHQGLDESRLQIGDNVSIYVDTCIYVYIYINMYIHAYEYIYNIHIYIYEKIYI